MLVKYCYCLSLPSCCAAGCSTLPSATGDKLSTAEFSAHNMPLLGCLIQQVARQILHAGLKLILQFVGRALGYFLEVLTVLCVTTFPSKGFQLLFLHGSFFQGKDVK